ncbi:sigma-70 family RNA polymerase sigma factor [Sulfuricurvum sp.]|uniref:RNA polymerase sigma factor n=1 Tax=Sulfuricurvum sp. TaxID=2025608 RepID=UPI00260A0C20|nr:sigma-70 family RNA polymerase sigma factor [Sulfuricurvum sp.]MDD3595081.1 sigma-70 family RNA polymerase sigma factor [Sulfuricurvum sp.]
MFEHYYNELIAYFSKTLKDRDRAHDAVHECYSRVLANVPGYPPIQEPRAFLYQTVRNILVDEHRKNVRYINVNIDDVVLTSHESEQPLEVIASDERMRKLQCAIDTLPPKCKEAFILFKFEGMPQAQIAEAMGISRKMVEKHIMNAMKVCKKCLKEIEE